MSPYRFFRTDYITTEPTIPPGHRNAIHHFVKNVQKELNKFIKNVLSRTTKPVKSHASKTTKARKPICVSDGLDSEVHLADATYKVRKQIIKWQNAQNNVHLRQLKEHREYKIELKQSTSEVDAITGTIKCTMCDANIHLGVDQKNNIKLSNWIRHVKICIKQKRVQGKQQLMTNYFSSNTSDNSSLPSSLPDSESLSDKPMATDDDPIISEGYTSEDTKQGFRVAPPIVKK